MKKLILCTVGLIMCVVILSVVQGCGTAVPFRKGKKSDASGLKKRVLVIPWRGASGENRDRVTAASDEFIARLDSSSSFITVPKPDKAGSGRDAADLEFEITKEVIDTAEDLGVNAVLTFKIIPGEVTTAKTGFWPFRGLSRIHVISMSVNVMDLATGCLILSRLDSEKVDFPVEEEGAQQEDFSAEALRKAVPNLFTRQKEAVEQSLEAIPWTGTITGKEKGLLRINAGDLAGAKPGQVFRVYSRGEALSTSASREVGLPGREIGRLRVKRVYSEYSLALPLEKEGVLSEGQIIRPLP